MGTMLDHTILCPICNGPAVDGYFDGGSRRCGNNHVYHQCHLCKRTFPGFGKDIPFTCKECKGIKVPPVRPLQDGMWWSDKVDVKNNAEAQWYHRRQ